LPLKLGIVASTTHKFANLFLKESTLLLKLLRAVEHFKGGKKIVLVVVMALDELSLAKCKP
jgi:hypothetical protein